MKVKMQVKTQSQPKMFDLQECEAGEPMTFQSGLRLLSLVRTWCQTNALILTPLLSRY